VLDSLFTITWRALGWLALFFFVCLAADRLLAAISNLPGTLFLVLALAILAFSVFASIYTVGKWVIHKLRPPDAIQ